MPVTPAGARAARAGAPRRRRFLPAAMSALIALSGMSLGPASAVSGPTEDRQPETSARVQAAGRSLSAEVIGYLPYWEMTSTTFSEIDLTKLTTIVLFSVGWDRAGHLRRDLAGYRAINEPATEAFVDRAQEAGVRVLVSFTSFGYTKNASFFTNPTAQATFVEEAATFVEAKGLDGADLDVELMEGIYRPGYAAVAGSLKDALRDRDRNATLTVATNGNVSGARMAEMALAAGADRAFLMGYSYRTAGSWPGPIDPLDRRAGDPGLSLTDSLNLYAAEGVPLGKVILGLPLYGRSWPTVSTALGSARRRGIPGAGDWFPYRRLGELAATGRVLRRDIVPVEATARLVRRVNGVIWQSFFDSSSTFRTKLRLVQTRGLAGAGLWALGYSNHRAEYWTAIGEVFGPPVITYARIEPSPTNSRIVTLHLRASGAQPAAQIRIANGSNAFGAWRPMTTPIRWTLPAGPAVASRTIRFQARDADGAAGRVTTRLVLYDRSHPVVATPAIVWSPLRQAWLVRYPGRDTGSGIAGYRIVLRRGGTTRTLAELRREAYLFLYIPRSAHFRITVRATDRAGNVSESVSASR
jgi:spore germination protein YaaH